VAGVVGLEPAIPSASYLVGIGDVMLAQKIALEKDEQAALAVANRGNPHQTTPRFG
jgi:hypothetical protein